MAEVLDQPWYDMYEQLTSAVPIFTQLRNVPDLDRKKQAFIGEDFQNNPDLRPEVDVTAARARSWGFHALHDMIAASNAEPVVKDAYLPILSDGGSTADLLYAASKGDVDTFVRLTSTTYDEPEKRVFNAMNVFFRRFAEGQAHNPQNAFVGEAARQALDLLPDPQIGDPWVWPTRTQFSQVQGLFGDYFEQMYDGIEIAPEVGSNEASGIIRTMLQKAGYDYKVVPQGQGLHTMAVNHKLKLVRVPQGETYTANRLKGLLAHELRVHVEESEGGKKQPLKILSKGLRGSASASEGKGLMVEQLAYDSWREFVQTKRFFQIAMRTFSIGLARGIDGNGERDFVGVWRIMHSLDRLRELTAQPDEPQAAVAKAIDTTWELLARRTLIGVVGTGAAYYKDKIYAEGNRRQWQLLTAHPETYPYINLGTYDLTKPEHVSILHRIGSLPTSIMAE